MVNANIIGSFVFRNEGDGCLTCKYINNDRKDPFTESSKLINNAEQKGFEGEYYTVWLENGVNKKDAILKIDKTSSSFDLSWKKKDKEIFIGFGMLFENLLVGVYWQEAE